MKKWGYIGMSCVAFWFQGLFFGWESCLYLMLLGLFIACFSLTSISVRIPRLESILLALFFVGFGMALYHFPTHATFMSFIQIGVVCLSVLIGLAVITKFEDVVTWYAAFQWNVLALVIVGWIFRLNGLSGSVFDYDNILAALTMVAIFLLLPRVFTDVPRKRWTTALLLIVYVCSLLMTGARIAWAITCVGVFLQTFLLRGHTIGTGGIKRIWWGGIAGIAIILIIVRLFLQDLWQELIQLSSLRIRLTYDWDALRIALDHPWAGVGADGWNKLQYFYQTALYSVRHVHNHFLQLWLEGGLLSLAAWCMFICILIIDYRLISKCVDQKIREVMCFVWVSTAAIVLYSSLDFILSFPALFFMVLFYLIPRHVIWYPNKHTVIIPLLKWMPLAIGAPLVLTGLLAGYRDSQALTGETALEMGEIRKVLQYESLSGWSIPEQERLSLVGRAYMVKAKRTNHPDDWQKALNNLAEGISRDPMDARFYPPYIYSLLENKQYKQAAIYANQLVKLQPSLIENYELYAEALDRAGKQNEAKLIPEELSRQKQKIYQAALFKRYIPKLSPTERMEAIIHRSSSH